MSLATLNGARVTGCVVQISAWGVWHADVECEGSNEVALTGAVTLILDDLTLRGTILSGGRKDTRTHYRVAGGGGGWGRRVEGLAYANDLGVRYTTLLQDVASSAGETMGKLPSGGPGTSYVRADGPASRVLEDLFPRGWYVDEAGITQIGRRPTALYAGSALRLSTDKAAGRVELAPTTSLAGLTPGVVVDELEAVDVEHVLDAEKLRTTLWGRGIADTSRESEALRRIVEAFSARYRFCAPWEYRVVQRSGDRYDLQITRRSSGLPDLRNVRVRAGLAGVRAHAKLGSLVEVSFANGDPARPFISSFDEADGAGLVADDLYLQAGSTGAQPTEHATSAEALLVGLQQTLAAIGTAVGAAGGPAAYLGAVISALAVDGAFAAIVTAASSATLGAASKAALATALAAKSADTAGDKPSLGWPSVRGG